MKKQRVVIELTNFEHEILRRAAMSCGTSPQEFVRYATITLINHTATRRVPWYKRLWQKVGVK